MQPKLDGDLRGRLKRAEEAIGVARPGRSRWVWVGPLINLFGTMTLILVFAHYGELELAAAIPLAIFCGLFMAGTSVAFLAASTSDVRDASADGD